MIELNDVSKAYGSHWAVVDLSLSIPNGELFAFLGPNGAGKTTTIKLLCGLLFPNKGTISIGGHDIKTDGKKARQMIGYVPDQPFLYEKLTTREIMRFVGEMYGMEDEEIKSRTEEMIERFELSAFIDDLTQNYSHGMRQRAVFAATMLHSPQLLIVDEPTVGLDPRSVRRLKELLRSEVERGATVFLSTHSLDFAQELADRIGVIRQGELIGCGTLEELRSEAQLDGNLEDVFLKLTDPEEGDQEREKEAAPAV